MSHKTVDCPVHAEEPFGVFANAFRLSSDGAEILLDFCVYSETENQAKVVSRVRISSGFLTTIHKKISEAFKKPGKSRGSLIVFPEIKGIN